MNQTHIHFPVAARRAIVKKLLLACLSLIALVSCSAQPAVTTSVPQVLMTDTPDYPLIYWEEFPQAKDCPDGKVCILWAVGLGSGGSPDQVAVEEEVIADFNASQDKIILVLVGVPWLEWDTLTTQIAYGRGPDIVGPVSWGAINGLHGEWL